MSTTAQTRDHLATLAARSLTKRFGARTALDAVSFELAPGELVGIVGPNGAGKTTLLSILAGVLTPTEGDIVRSAGRPFGWVPQQPALYSKLSVVENLRLFARLERLADPEAAVSRMLRETDLEDRADEEVGRLSGGNRQRVNIAIGLLSEPSALLLDEPSASLDPRQRERLWEFIGALADGGTTVVFSTHNVAEVDRYARKVLVLVDGELLFTGTPSEFERVVEGDGAERVAERDGTGGEEGGALAPDFEAAFVRFLHRRGH